ncbi:MAG TPA: tellurite resistance TerB family protein [Alphaproteobacteria bacterium]|nr:tellurite resistance TerB family protein [Alphaproteobacteria bacterium]
MLFSHQDALVYVMVMTSAADRDMADAELRAIGERVRHLPVFAGYPEDRLVKAGEDCTRQLRGADGLKQTLSLVAEMLPTNLRETAYLLAAEVAAADGLALAQEHRLLQLIARALGLDPLVAAALSRAARARFAA